MSIGYNQSFKLFNSPKAAYANMQLILNEGVNNLSNLPEKPINISNKVIDLLVDDTLRRNGIDPENIKKKLTDHQKQQLKDLVEDLTKQVNTFTEQPTEKKNL
ncbi:hypothetical protein SAMN05421670_0833 [Psychrobacillus psychrotolerans]|uniref:Spore coat protein W n=1 Tax=Psychrobacillus psychrotolerans TaxID=126156 RepID=A0A1I5VIA3_9BACI|nr:hypothetical protein [Psychrobacillus psychrotolerans]SFQ07288.1 hypothetical protein SAMN05421670_0833 [Psychrobacillus psychrotolerans]